VNDRKTVRVDGVDLHYREAGAGPPLVLVHGLGSCAEDWEYQVPAFAPHFRVICPDLRGHGASRAAPGPCTIEQFASDLRQVFRLLEVDNAVVLGISMGGAVALQLAADAPELVSRLVLVNTLAEMAARGFGDRMKILERLLLVKTCSMAKLGKILVRRVLPAPGQEALRQTLAERFKRNDKPTYQASLRSLLRWRITERLASIDAPTLVMASEHDYTPVSAKEVFATGMPNARLVVIPASHHAASQEHPEVFNRMVLDFLGCG